MAMATAPLTSLNPLSSETRLVSHGPSKYRGAVVEDLQLPPAFALSRSENVAKAIQLAYDRDFSYIPVLDSRRKPVGYINVADLKTKWEAGSANPSDLLSNYMTKFARGTGVKYTVITPETPLEELEAFLETTDFAIVTDWNRKFVLGVATKDDLSNFVTRRGA
ncbi:Cystathionine beta-synthase OS=Dictyostelium discoideum GN=cysB PE=2 SV=2 [Rhizoctonia solani AG-1 IB]|uniref:Cystathionine beta-synthase n=1 Tax=Thanatephorus cucumeris (strain AG1-IB / isolate 7/3/14) TaxID=1108050 RepID=A0A0B7FE15_THACB|nr:Cystathionine beta-synthase OS=Dictyostelium discoideum GN=cysB PE=2 SV=2 [Rhizoctonia solani AG-1 IB]